MVFHRFSREILKWLLDLTWQVCLNFKVDDSTVHVQRRFSGRLIGFAGEPELPRDLVDAADLEDSSDDVGHRDQFRYLRL